MRLSWMATCLWPGLSRLWIAGQWAGLLSAFAFAVALNFLLAATFIWPEWLESILLVVGWTAVAGFWMFSAYSSLRWLRSDAACQFGGESVEQLGARLKESPDENGESTESFSSMAVFSIAQTEYLKGHWFEAEAAIKELLTHNARDIEARLLWVCVLRRMKRVDAANRQLKILARLEGAERWALEIRDERRRVHALAKSVAHGTTVVTKLPPSGDNPGPAEDLVNEPAVEHHLTQELETENRTDEAVEAVTPPDDGPRTVPFARQMPAIPAQSPPPDAIDDASLSEAA